MAVEHVNVAAAWLSMAAGAVWGALMGICFHNADWLGGYASFQRRLLRLGHVACFGLAFINLAFAFTVGSGYASGNTLPAVGALLIVALVTMPSVSALTAWKTPFRHLFFIPVLSTFLGIVGTLLAVCG